MLSVAAGRPSMKKNCRDAFTLVELVVAMASASMLLVGLAAAIIVTNRSLEDAASPEDRSSIISSVADRFVDDVRYATAIRNTGSTIEMDVPDRDGDTLAETIVYSGSNAGLLRSQSLHPTTTFVASGPTLSMRLDGSIAPTDESSLTPIRLLSSMQMATTSRTWFSSIEMPAGTRAGDLLVLVAVGDDSRVGPWGGSWNAVKYHDVNGVLISLFTRVATTTELATQNLFAYTLSPTSMVATVFSFSGEGSNAFDDNFITSSGMANPSLGTGIPGPLQLATVPTHAMNLQVLAFKGNPPVPACTGLASFSDASFATATHAASNVVSLATTLRNGKSSSATPAAFLFTSPTQWAQVAAQWWL